MTIEVARAPQEIVTFVVPAGPHAFGDPTFEVSASASSGLTVTIAAPGACALAGSAQSPVDVALVAAGTCTLVASQAGDTNWLPVEVSETVDVGQASQTITIGAPDSATYGDAPFTVTASATSELPVTITASGACTVPDTSTAPVTVAITGAGSCDLTASQAGDANWAAAQPVTATVPVAKAATATGLEATLTSAPVGTAVAAGAVTQIQVAGRGAVPDSAVAAFFNVVAVDGDDAGHVLLYPCGVPPPPVASTLNVTAGEVRANNSLTKLGVNGTVCLYTHAATDVVLDVTGWIG